MSWVFYAGYRLFRNLISNWFSLKSKSLDDINSLKRVTQSTNKLALKLIRSKDN